jgi:hypothetical protein
MIKRMLAIALAVCLPLCAQWAPFPVKGVPRNADGKPDFDAPVPKLSDGKPDLSGMWSLFTSTGYSLNITADQKPGFALPWAAAYYKQQMEDVGKNDPNTIGCLPMGPRRLTGGGMTKIIHTPNLVVMLSEDLTYRQIFLDGRPLPEDPQPTFVGYSVGHWEGDILVVETIGFNERTWIDMGGHPHTDALKMTERFHRTAFGRMELSVTLDDPKAYVAPWTVKVNVAMQPDAEFIEYVCNETPKSTHLVGRNAQEAGTKVAPNILAKYVGTYEATERKRTYKITQSGGDLLLDIDGKGSIPFIPLSETTFSPRLGGVFVFYFDAKGNVTHFVSNGADEVVTAVRK